MMKLIVGLVALACAPGALANNQPDPTAPAAASYELEQLLDNVGFTFATDLNGDVTLEAVSAERPDRIEQLKLPCEDYDPGEGCSIVYNDGYSCTEVCNGGNLQVCSCVI